MNETVLCERLDGTLIEVPRCELTVRPAVYALIVTDGRVLLLRMRANGKYHLPGGGIEPGERMQVTLVRELREETGLDVSVTGFLHFNEIFFYYDPSERGYHGLHFYYACRVTGGDVLPDAEVHDSSAEKPRWVPVNALSPAQFQADGAMILALIQKAAQVNAATIQNCEE